MIMNVRIPKYAFSRWQDEKSLATKAEWGSVGLATLWTRTLYFCGAHVGLVIITIIINDNNNSNEAEEEEKEEKVKVQK